MIHFDVRRGVHNGYRVSDIEVDHTSATGAVKALSAFTFDHVVKLSIVECIFLQCEMSLLADCVAKVVLH